MSDALEQQYGVIERLYSQGHWQEVLDAIAAIQDALPADPGDPLRARVTLLQGHTLLYGLDQVQEAAAIYRQVLTAGTEAVLASIAQQELARCDSMLEAQPVAAGSAFPFAAEAVGAPPVQQQAAAMPWMDALGGLDPAANQPTAAQTSQAPWIQAAEVIEEPEQIEVQQADPSRAVVVDLEPLDILKAARLAAAKQEPAPQAVVAAPQDLADAQTPEQKAAESAGPPAAQPAQQPRWSPAEEAELARGLLTVVLR
jgi:hypothetical protein